jgi:hypothetical protein
MKLSVKLWPVEHPDEFHQGQFVLPDFGARVITLIQWAIEKDIIAFYPIE